MSREDEAKQRVRDIRAVAKTREGRRLFARLVCDEATLDGKFNGNSQDAYSQGRRHVAVEWRNELKNALPREVFLEIIYPILEEHHDSAESERQSG